MLWGLVLVGALATLHDELVQEINDRRGVVLDVEVLLLDERELTQCLKEYSGFVYDFEVEEGPVTVRYHFLGRKSYPEKWWNSLLKDGMLEAEAGRLLWRNAVFFQYVWVQDEGPCHDLWENSTPILYVEASLSPTQVQLKRNCAFPQAYFHKWFMET
jgi:hypothetical protein